jgi:hypothetical protein
MESCTVRCRQVNMRSDVGGLPPRLRMASHDGPMLPCHIFVEEATLVREGWYPICIPSAPGYLHYRIRFV